MQNFDDHVEKTVDHYARMALNPGSIDHARHMVRLLQEDKSKIYAGIALLVKKRIEELKENK